MLENNLDKEENKKEAKLHINIDNLDLKYASQFNIQSTPEEVFIDLASCSFPGKNQNEMIVPIHTRIIMNHYNVKRLALALNNTINKYEENYGTLEMDQNKRKISGKITQKTTTAQFPRAIITKRQK